MRQEAPFATRDLYQPAGPDLPVADVAEVRRKIRAYLSRAVPGRELGDDEDIFELGLAHSLFVMQIVIFIEREFQIELEPDDIERDELSTVSSIAGLVVGGLGRE